jgi:hypothetical protein
MVNMLLILAVMSSPATVDHMDKADMKLRLQQHIQGILVDLAVDETLSEAEVADVEDGMNDLAEMLIDSLKAEFTEQDGEMEVTFHLAV